MANAVIEEKAANNNSSSDGRPPVNGIDFTIHS
jgi:hypothetical protein